MTFITGHTIWLGRKHSKESIEKMSIVQKATPNSARYKKGVKHSEERNAKVAASRIGKRNSRGTEFKSGKDHPNWADGISSERTKLTNSPEYRKWRSAVYRRDNYTCVICKDNAGGNLEADHIKPFALFPTLRYVVANGRTLCVPCHRKTDTWGGRLIKYKALNKL